MSRDQRTDRESSSQTSPGSTALDAEQWTRGEGIGQASATPHWQRDAGAGDPVQYKLWCDSRLADLSAPIQRREESECDKDQDPDSLADAPEALKPKEGAPPDRGVEMPEQVRAKMEGSFGADFGGVRLHEGGQAEEKGAKAFTQGSDVHFAPGQYDPASERGQELLGHELAHVVQQGEGRVAAPAQQKGAINADRGLEAEADDWGAKAARGEPVGRAGAATADVDGEGPVQRKEYGTMVFAYKTGAGQTTKADWSSADRTGNTARWQEACLRNLNAVDSAQYERIVERRDFYKWFYEYTAARGFQTRWALAAYVVANGAHEIADMDGWIDDGLSMTNIQLQGIMREGNQVIFDNVLPKLKKLLDGGPLKGKAALDWDKQVLAEEQHLVQPLYDKMAQSTKDKLNYIARKKRFVWLGGKVTGADKVDKGTYNKGGRVPAFDEPDITKPEDRWKYGMELGQTFAPEDTGYKDGDAMPSVGAGYKDGTEFKKVDDKAALHQLDAWLSPERVARYKGQPGADLDAIVGALTEENKKAVADDFSPDGWRYSTQFAHIGGGHEAEAKKAMPSDPAYAGKVTAFMANYKKEKDKADLEMLKYQYPMGMGF